MTLESTVLAPPVAPADSPVCAAPTAARRQSWLKAHLELGKVRLNALVVCTTALGFVVGSKLNVTRVGEALPFEWGKFFWTALGTFLAAAGASAFNQALEARRDARMNRTRRRPLCTGRLTRTYAAALGLIVGLCGVAVLWPTSNGLTAALAAGNILLYGAVYTPLKRVSTVNTLVGAVVGAVPPVLGWTAAAGALAPGALVLGAILFVWQIPHFLALGWMYREDYARGGFKMLPVVDAGGRLTGGLALVYALLLVPLCLLVHFLQHAGAAFVVISFGLSVGLIVVALRFARTRGNAEARRLFFATISYLPILCLVLMLDARNPERERMAAAQRAGDFAPFVDPGSAEGRGLNAGLTAPAAPQAPPANSPP